MRSMDADFLENQSIPTLMSGSLQQLGRYQGKQELVFQRRPELLKTLKHQAVIESVESSNRIEGVIVPEKRLKEILSNRDKPKNRSEEEVVGYRNVLAEIHTNYKHMEITPESICKMHKKMFDLTNRSKGVWKNKDNSIEEQLPDGTWITRFLPVSAKETPYYMAELCKRFNRLWNEQRVDRLFVSLAFVFDFLWIHPFLDGNGRLSRLLTVLLLHKMEYDIPWFISLERLIEDTKEFYYDTLKEVSQGWHKSQHHLGPWLGYHITLLLKSYRELEEKAGDAILEKGEKTTWVLEAIKSLPTEFRVGDLIRLCPGVSRPMIRVVLENLRKEGKLTIKGLTRSARWRKVKESDF
ncbi:MAG: Fic family protein [Chlamydiales bacterium]|nr:Fic family protein [Chlamydiales bacterium]